jgi:hypothetical protein
MDGLLRRSEGEDANTDEPCRGQALHHGQVAARLDRGLDLAVDGMNLDLRL